MLGGPDPLRVVFGPNVTWALNVALQGMLQPGDHVVTSSIEHNSVMRPLRALERSGVEVSVVRCAPDGSLDPGHIRASLSPRTKMVVLSHASNVLGTLLPIAEVGAITREVGITFLVDSAQTAGAVPLHTEQLGIDLLAFTGHKSLCGPMGTGGLIFGPRIDPRSISPLIYGGTGSASDRELQPDFLPDRFESGTPNVVGLAGLAAGVRWVLERGVESIRRDERALASSLIDGLSAIRGVTVLGPSDNACRTATVSFTMDRLSPSEAALALDEDHRVLCRAGLHCAPACHTTAGTFPQGAIRFSLGPMNTPRDVERAIEAVAAVRAGTE
ncbi:MAG: aminotransferase class V-fold PLP-dependent enzyme [Chitinivibrionales bacterium]|nr:aminotransferase class V-fold PLP-dependent enzyme [Chitinivibrionales bacterium]